jgi:hypothetical protein
MSWIRSRTFALMAGTLGLAAVLGGSLGLAAAGTRPSLVAGVNPTVGGPLSEQLSPATWVKCLPASSWASLYVWDAPNQRWLHYFNTAASGVPAYVNNSSVNGISSIPRFAGVAVIMNSAVSNPFFPDKATDACPP